MLTLPKKFSTVMVRGGYGQVERSVERVSDTAVWYHAGMPPLLIRWVLVRDPQRAFEPQAWLCTDMTVDSRQIRE